VSVGDIRAEALGVAVKNEVTLENQSGYGALADGATYSVVELETAVGIGGTNYNYALLDNTGQVVAVSEDGSSYSVLSVAKAIDDLSSGGIDKKVTAIDFDSDSVTRGTVSIQIVENTTNSKGFDITATATRGIDVLNQTQANDAITTIQDALNTVSTERSKLGAVQNRLEHTIANLGVAAENLTAAESRIRDVDMAKEMMEFTKNQILIQAGTAMLAHANVRPQSVLQLLG